MALKPRPRVVKTEASYSVYRLLVDLKSFEVTFDSYLRRVSHSGEAAAPVERRSLAGMGTVQVERAAQPREADTPSAQPTPRASDKGRTRTNDAPPFESFGSGL